MSLHLGIRAVDFCFCLCVLIESALSVESIIGWKNQAEAGLQRSVAI